jgi:ABC-type nitrate/sulfonate/bicarbonate transport system permease component
MNLSLSTLQSTDMFASIIVLSVVGIALVFAFRWIERRTLHWSAEFRETT